MKFTRKIQLISLLLVISLLLAACAGEKEQESKENPEQKKVKLMLDWVPNTNHTGLYVAQEKGYFADEGLDVEIATPAETTANQLVGAGKADFGISSQEYVTQARAEGVPIVSVAAILQHNTSGFMAPKNKGIKKPKDFIDKTYGGWGTPIENAFIRTVLKMDGVQVEKVEDKVNIVNMGEADFFTATKRNVDFSWVYYGWTGVEAELRDVSVDFLELRELDPVLDFYTPTLITNETLIKEDPKTVRKLVKAVSRGYQYAIKHPKESADILLKAAPETDKKLAHASQKWISKQYQADADRWGEQKKKTWIDFTDWMFQHKLIKKKIDPNQSFTNEFLPEK
ncbi:ABC transporter substrate-binding protein [Melghirimyces algeriensis]|uniref:ABC-type nitrate/sulfonate/bicarbonate transport system, substrate-binding protein n=1 Tax=Melghirimyces algeriensis TaxID=910412 RepID=A0A521EM78_9BACL|nr:ABC transporter substrate-binding protein [Melghirimyces algeriensis]SMO84541.1 ABC-type nitrate/sulfonate/bicarbonate transport system, substrate-binding protein [Melghirimyces algeriensis]